MAITVPTEFLAIMKAESAFRRFDRPDAYDFLALSADIIEKQLWELSIVDGELTTSPPT
jgi:hypothetical protein